MFECLHQIGFYLVNWGALVKAKVVERVDGCHCLPLDRFFSKVLY